jgi:predicted nuclease of predicted toxin-antitoxin system
LRLLLDEHISPVVAERLRDRGHEVVTVSEVGLAGIDDARVLAWAAADRRAVVTANIRDFRPLHALHLTTGTAHHGIVLVPAGRYSLRRDRLGPLVAALDQLLARRPAGDALCDTEHFL